jgi:hypothetical protein
MDITRRASERFHKMEDLTSNLSLICEAEGSFGDNVRWDKCRKVIVIRVSRVPHPDGRTRHDYDIRLSLEDMSVFIALLGHAGSASDASLLRDHLGEQVPALVKLLACAAGLVPTPMVESGEPVECETMS